MITFKHFIAENREDSNYPEYPDINDPVHIGWVHDQNVSKYEKMKEEAAMLTKK